MISKKIFKYLPFHEIFSSLVIVVWLHNDVANSSTFAMFHFSTTLHLKALKAQYIYYDSKLLAPIGCVHLVNVDYKLAYNSRNCYI